MASNNEAKIRFTAETSDFTQAIKDANSEMSTLRAEMKLNEAQFQNTGDQTEYLSQKTALLEAQLEANADKQEALTQKLEAARDIYGEDSEEVSKLERQLIYAQTEEEKLKGQLEQTNQGLTDQSQAADTAGESVDSMSEILVNAGIAAAIKEIADAAYDLAGAFDDANAAIVEGTGASGEALEELNQTAHSAFSRIADADQDLSGVADILAELNTRFGVTGESAEDLTVSVANFAHHTGTDGTKAVDDIANVMNRWGMDIDDVDGLLDDLTTANQSCQMSVDEMTRYLSENSIQFQELGYSTEDALAMLISLSDGGANVSSVMSGMKKAVGNLSEVTDDVPGAFQDAIKAISECDNVSEALQAQVGDTGLTVEEVFGAKAAQELAANVQNGNFNLEKWTQVLQENQGALADTTENATTMQDAWTQATNSVSVALGSSLAPAISDVVIKVSEIITKVAQVVQKSPALQAIITGVATALGILGAALGISAAITAVQKAFAMLNTTLLVNPIFLVVTAIAALAAGLIYAYKHSEKFRNIVNKVFNGIKTVVLTVVNAVKKVIQTAFKAILGFFNNTWPKAKQIVVSVWNAIKNTVSTVVNGIKTVIQTVFNVIKTIIILYLNAYKTVIVTVWNAIKTVVTTVVNAIKTVIQTVFNAIKTVVTSAWNAIKSATSSAWNAIKNAVTTPINAAKSAVSSAVGSIKSTASSAWSSIKSATSSAWNSIKSAITSPIQSAKSTVSSVFSSIKSTVSGAVSSVKSTVSSGFSAVKSAITKPFESAKSTLSGIVSKIKGFFPINFGKILHFSLPKISVSGGKAPWGIGGKGTKPSFGVTWSSHAAGGVFDKPTLIPTMRAIHEVGEAGPEAISPISVLQDYIGAAVQRYMPMPINYDLLGMKVAEACAKMDLSIELNHRELGRVVREVV